VVLRPGVPDDEGLVVLPVTVDEGGVENLLAEPLADGRFRLVCTPGLIQGFAADDVIRYHADRRSAELVSRGMKVGVQFYHPALDDRVVAHIEGQVTAVGGSVDGHLQNLLVLTFPVGVRVGNIQSFLREYEERFGAEWFFANLFTDDGRPLEWWKDHV
jgi:hypothetical protein